MTIKILEGELEAYWEQGWEGRVEYSLYVQGAAGPLFLESGQHLSIFSPDGSILWEGKLEFVSRKNEQHNLPLEIWSDIKQKGLDYSQWMEWFTHQPPLRAKLEIEERV
jgi:hypothetical protein